MENKSMKIRAKYGSKKRICDLCGVPFGSFKAKRNGKVVDVPRWMCTHCNVFDPKTEYYNFRMRAKHITDIHPEKVKILKECPCDVSKKDKHHPDYNKPFEIELLCRKCHSKAHLLINPNYNRPIKQMDI